MFTLRSQSLRREYRALRTGTLYCIRRTTRFVR